MFGQQLGRSARRAGQAAWCRILTQQGQTASQRRCYAAGAPSAQGSSSSSGGGSGGSGGGGDSRTSTAGRAAGLLSYGAAFCGLGAAATWYVMGRQLKGFSDAESIMRFVPATEKQRRIEARINALPLVAELRANADFTESRPHMKMAPAVGRQSLTGGTLATPERLAVPPYIWSEKGGKSLVCVGYAGGELCGYPGKLHGGFLATMLDEGLARCCFAALPHRIAMTARLELDYRKPASAEDYFVMRARTTKVEGRKAWVEGWIETLPKEGEEPVVLVEAKALFVSPKFAAMIPKIIE
ncbi:UPF0644 protein [Escovopsis weberi]|uniref:UPF0644 protein n=1 Tax=Escovopsis weberi TaxID=150374 RepID=A0A0M8MX03_ESCWE|nr:UPF0644 protein [Escovopsis weberi]